MEHDLVVDGRVVTPAGIEELQVGVSEGSILEIRKQGLKGARTVKAGRCIVFPGFVDGHTHMREPGWEYKEDFHTGTAAAAHGGVTTVVDMPNNPKPATTPSVLEEKHRLARSKGIVDVQFHGGVNGKRIDELKSIRQFVVGYKLFLAKSTGSLTFPLERLGTTLRAVAATGLPLSMHCEDQSIIDSREKALAGEKRPDLHCDIRPPEAEVSSVEKVFSVLRQTPGVSVNICHASVSRTLSLINQARGGGLRVACEATLHHVFFSRKAMEGNPLLETNPPLRAEPDRSSLLAGLRAGEVNFLVTDHAPHTRDEKVIDRLSGVPGLDDYGHIVAWLMKSQDFDTSTIARVCSANPAAFYGLNDRGEISVGKRADFTILDMGSPETTSESKLLTKCGWSPYEGVEFPGRVRWTIRKGEVLLEDSEPVWE